MHDDQRDPPREKATTNNLALPTDKTTALQKTSPSILSRNHRTSSTLTVNKYIAAIPRTIVQESAPCMPLYRDGGCACCTYVGSTRARGPTDRNDKRSPPYCCTEGVAECTEPSYDTYCCMIPPSRKTIVLALGQGTKVKPAQQSTKGQK